jgi:iron complex transport system ATP-binding protein
MIIGTKAVSDSEFVKRAVDKYGKKIVIGIDAKDGMVAIEGWEKTSDFTAVEFAKKMAVVLTDKLKTELMTCYDVVATGRYPYTGRFGVLSDEDKKAVDEAMELLGIEPAEREELKKRM